MKARSVLFGLMATAAVVDLGRSFSEMRMHADMLGQLEVRAESEALRAAVEPQFTGLPFEEAVAFFKRKAVLEPAAFDALEDRYKAKGFSMAEVHSRHVLETAHEALGDAIAKGLTEQDTLKRMRQAFVDAGVDTPEGYHLQTTFDNAVLGSYAAGRYEQLTHPDVLRSRPYWQYVTAGDTRVRPSHVAMNGKVFPADAPVWQTWYPPNGWRCRCGVDSVSREEVERRGLTVEQELPRTIANPDGTVVQMLPDPGWSGSPATQITADRTVARIRTEAHRTGALEATGPDLNRAADAERRRKVDRFAALEEPAIADRLKENFVFNVLPGEDPAPAAGELHVDWHMYSQNLDSAEQLVTRLVQSDGLYGMKDRVGILARASYLSEWNPELWPDPEVVYDDALARKLGVAAGLTSARSTEYAIRLRVKPAELDQVLAFLDEHGERGPGKTPVRRAWEIQDVRIRAGEGAELPETARYRRGYRNLRQEESGRVLATLSKKPLEGFDRAELVSISGKLWEYLP